MSTFKDKFKEVLEDLGGRIQNPLITSFILVWLYKHWLLIFVIFSFGEFPLVAKAHYLLTYIKLQGLCGMVLSPILYSFYSLSVYYLIAIMAQLLKLLIGTRLNAAVITMFDKGKYIQKSEYDKVKRDKQELKNANEQLEAIKDNALSKLKQKEAEFDRQTDKLNKTLSAKDSEIGTLSADLLSVQKQRTELQLLNEKLKTENLLIEELKSQLKVEKEANKIRYEDNQRLEELLRHKTPMVSTRLQDVFGSDIWELSFYNSKGNLFKERFVLEGNDTFALTTSNEKIKITNFKYIKDKNFIEFNKTNPDKGYSNVYTRLSVFEEGLLVGKEGKLSVTYTREK